MKQFDAITFDYEECRKQLEEFRALLAANGELSERKQILPLFQERRQLCSLFGIFNYRINFVNRFAKEFDIFGDFSCDVAVGDSTQGEYCFVEFEDARMNSIFTKKGAKATREWGIRFDHGFSQVIDWVHKLSGRDVSNDNLQRFGRYEIDYETVLVIGRDAHQDASEMQRLKWRSNHVSVGGRKVHCVTFDQLLTQFDARMTSLEAIERYGATRALGNTPPPTV